MTKPPKTKPPATSPTDRPLAPIATEVGYSAASIFSGALTCGRAVYYDHPKYPEPLKAYILRALPDNKLDVLGLPPTDDEPALVFHGVDASRFRAVKEKP